MKAKLKPLGGRVLVEPLVTEVPEEKKETPAAPSGMGNMGY